MIEAYQQAAEGKLMLDDPVTLADADKVPGSGILTSHFSAGAKFSVRDTVRLMIVFSDNTATNLVLDKIGIGSTAARMDTWGFPNTKIHAKVFRRETSVFPERSQEFGLGSTTAPKELLDKGGLVASSGGLGAGGGELKWWFGSVMERAGGFGAYGGRSVQCTLERT
jgi:beta-lactamase class A